MLHIEATTLVEQVQGHGGDLLGMIGYLHGQPTDHHVGIANGLNLIIKQKENKLL